MSAQTHRAIDVDKMGAEEARALISANLPIAARVSTRRETVARELKALERAGLIERRRGAIALSDTDHLRRLVEVAIKEG